ncbi:MAG: serine hydrolase, partial [Bryobacteraceae bacterium]
LLSNYDRGNCLTNVGTEGLPGAAQDPRISQITIQNLLDHKSGWYGEADGTGYDPLFDVDAIATAAGVTPPADCPTIVRFMLGRPLDTNPGTYYSYLNFGYCVLGQVVQKVSGQSYESFVTANVTGPLGNNRTHFGATLTALPGEVTYYPYPGEALAASVFPTGPALVPWPYGGYSVEANHADGGLVSNTIELLRFLSAVNGSRLPALFQNPVDGFPVYVPPYGPGWSYYFHGSLPGNNASIILLPDQTEFCWLTNTRPANSDSYFNDFDSGLINDINQVTTWPSTDLFPQFQTSFAVVHAASYQALATAPDQYVTLLGANLAASTERAGSPQLPTTLAGATVTVADSGGNSQPAELSFASANQINLVVPGSLAPGAATIRVQTGAGMTLSTTMQIDPVSPGLFTANGNGTGAPAALAGRYTSSGVVTPVNVFQCRAVGDCAPTPMSLGSSDDQLIVSLYGTGIRHAAGPVRATIGGQPATVLFAGAQNQFLGLDQVNVQVPSALQGRGNVIVQLLVDGRSSNPVTIALQ